MSRNHRNRIRDFSVVPVGNLTIAVEQRHITPLVAAGMRPQEAAEWVAQTMIKDSSANIPLLIENKANRLLHAARKLADEQEIARTAEAADLEAARADMNSLGLSYTADESASTLRAKAKVKRAQIEAAEKQTAQLELIKTETAGDLKSLLLAALLEKMTPEDLARMLLGQPAPAPQVAPTPVAPPAPKRAPKTDEVGIPVIEYHKCRDGYTRIRFDRKLSKGSHAHAVMVKQLHFQWRPDLNCWLGNGHVTRRSIEQRLAK